VIKPFLLFGYGNPGRGDDALGPAFVESIEAMQWPSIDCLQDMQLQVEHITDMEGRARVIFVDADVSCAAPYQFEPVIAAQDSSYTSHAMSPQALVHAYQQVYGKPPPATFVLRLRGQHFELGDGLSEAAKQNLQRALDAFTTAPECFGVEP